MEAIFGVVVFVILYIIFYSLKGKLEDRSIKKEIEVEQSTYYAMDKQSFLILNEFIEKAKFCLSDPTLNKENSSYYISWRAAGSDYAPDYEEDVAYDFARLSLYLETETNSVQIFGEGGIRDINVSLYYRVNNEESKKNVVFNKHNIININKLLSGFESVLQRDTSYIKNLRKTKN